MALKCIFTHPDYWLDVDRQGLGVALLFAVIDLAQYGSG